MTLEATLLFAATIFAISMTPGLCMTLAFTLGMRFGYRRTLWMMAGELAGVATVAISVALGGRPSCGLAAGRVAMADLDRRCLSPFRWDIHVAAGGR
jgi:hypothetical protein